MPAHLATGRWWAGPLGLAIIAGLSVLDAHWGPNRVIIAAVVIAPFVTALAGSMRQTLLVGTAAIAAVTLSGGWNDNYGDADWFARLLITAAGSVLAVSGAVSRRRLATDRERFRMLSAAAGISHEAVTADEVVERIGELLVPALADICVIDVVRGDRVERVAVSVEGSDAATIEAGLRRRSDQANADQGLALTAMRSGDAYLTEHATDEVLRASAQDETDLEFLRSLETRSSMVVPLRARGRSIGSLALMVTATSGRRYGADDLEFAQVLSGRVALALDNAGLFSEVESLEAQQAAALGSLAEAVTVQNARGELIYANEAAGRALGFASAAELLATPTKDIVDAYETFNEDGSPLTMDQLPGRQALAGETPQPLLVRAIHRASGQERWRVTKATAVLGADGRPRLAVNVIEDVTEVKRAELAQAFLARAGELLSSSLDYEQTLAQVADLVVPKLADWCGVSIPDEDGYLRTVAVTHVDPDKVRFALDYQQRYPVRLSDEGGSAQVARDGISQLVNDIPDELLEQAIPDADQLAALRTIGMRAVMLVPMVTAGGVVGTISFVSAESGRAFGQADLELAEELGRRAGTAVENARMYTERSRVAHTLQASLLPEELPEVPGFDLAALYRPAGEASFVGGDFYDAFPTGSGWMMAIGDVTGRGAPAAALTAQARHTLRTAGTLLGDPVAAVDQLNRALAARHDLSICTVAAVQVRERDGDATATIVCAGQPQPYLVRNGEVRPVGQHGLMVGAWADSTWEPQTIDLLPGDVLVLYTDGVIDAVGDDGRFGAARLATALRGTTGAQEAVTRIREALDAFEHGAQADDTAVFAIQRAPSPVSAERSRGPADGTARGDE